MLYRRMADSYWEEYLRDNLEEWARDTEQKWCEFKENCLDPQRIGEYVSALSNGACLQNKDNGWLVFGVREAEGKVVGTQKRWQRMKVGNQDLELHLRQNITPSLEIEFYTLLIQNEPVLALRVEAACGEPVRYKGKSYVRINSQTTELHKYPDLARYIYNSASDWSSVLVNEATVDDLDAEAVAKAREKFAEAHPSLAKEAPRWAVMTLMEKLFLAKKGRLTRAALILLGKPESVVLLSPAVVEVTWRLKSGTEEAYEHFGPPFLLSTSQVLARIRNYKQKIFPDTSLLPEEVMKYESEVFLEALHNCIAHQDYRKQARIVVLEKEDRLIFKNQGGFYCGKPDDYLQSEETPDRYRNKLLAMAMKSLLMVDTVGSGIRKMYRKQMERCFPLPDYVIKPDSVELCIHGRIIDEAYTKLLIEETDMPLEFAIALDRVQKKLPVNNELLTALRKKGYVEGYKGNYRIGRVVAVATGQKVAYIREKGVDKELIKQHIINMLGQMESLSRQEITECVQRMLPASYDGDKVYNFITSLIREMSKKDGSIYNCVQSRKDARWKLK